MKVFLTGASSGIGEALARHYASRGATLGLFARRADLLKTLKESLGTPAETYAGDVREIAALKSAAADFIAKHGVPDLVIGNAGVSHGTLTEHEEDAAVFRDILASNSSLTGSPSGWWSWTRMPLRGPCSATALVGSCTAGTRPAPWSGS